MKRFFFAAASGFALAITPAPTMAQSDDASAEELIGMGQMFAEMFTSEPLTAEQEARLPAAQAIIDTMMPEGFYAEIMGDVMTSTLEPMMSMMSGPMGADLMLPGRLSVDPEIIEGMSDEEKVEVASLLDPGFAQRGPLMQNMMNDIMREVAIAIEPGFREGMAKAYAVRFDADQLGDIAAFFETPTGLLYARENIMLMTDPQVMSASMQAMPAMMEQFGDLGEELEAAMAELPSERGLGDLSETEKARLAELLATDVVGLSEIVISPTSDADSEF